MADGHRGDAALGLRRLARIADDERIDHRQRADDGLGEAGGGQRHGLARQPFERAVRAHMHDGIGTGDVPQPQPEGEQRMARRQRRIVIVGAPVGARPRSGGSATITLPNCARGSGRRRRGHRDRLRGVAPGRMRSRVATSAGKLGEQARDSRRSGKRGLGGARVQRIEQLRATFAAHRRRA